MKSFCDRALGRLAFRAPQRDARLFCDGQKFLAEGCIHDEAKVLDMKKFIRVFGTWCTGRQYCVALWNSHYAPLMFHLAQAFPLLPTQMLTIRVFFSSPAASCIRIIGSSAGWTLPFATI